MAPMSVTSVLEVVRGLCYERRPATDLMLSRLLLLFWVNVRTVLHTERADGTMTSLKRPSFPFILFTLYNSEHELFKPFLLTTNFYR